MNTKTVMKIMASITLCMGMTAQASTATKYLLTITNGGLMPISPAVIYVKGGQTSKAQIGTEPTMGFIKLCQTGDRSTRVVELNGDMSVTSSTETTSPIFPGENRTVEIEVQNQMQQSLHFESMYGKSKDICAVGSFSGHNLYALKAHVTSDVITKDNVLMSGAFIDPVLPMDQSTACHAADSAIDCLRELSLSNQGKKQIRFFAGYLPSIINFLETKYGSEDTKTLLLPTSGAVQLQLKLKH